MFRFPQGAQNLLDELLRDAGSLREEARGLSERYRKVQSEGGAGKSLLMDEKDVLAYASSRMPATYAALCAVLEASLPCLSEQPRSVLDVGAGPGTASLAVMSLLPEVGPLQLVERDAHMAALAGKLLAAQGRRANLLLDDMRTAPMQKADLVIAAYSLLELPDSELEENAKKLYALANQALILLEPGTPAGHKRLERIRRVLMEQGAKVAAPCPEVERCHLPCNDWCAFSKRLQRSARHRQEKGGTLGFEDEKFSYLTFIRGNGNNAQARIRRHPRIYKGYVELELCTKEGCCTRRVAKSSPLYRQARNADAGQAFTAE